MFLDEIAAKTRERVKAVSPGAMRRQAETLVVPGRGVALPFEAALSAGRRTADGQIQGFSFICEVKRASPSKGLIASGPEGFPYLDIAKEYEKAGAQAISVLTEPDYFLGSNDYLREIAAAIRLPVLRKDFIIDEYQLYEAKVLGAGAVLLICALLDLKTLSAFIALAKELELAVLAEVHHGGELERALAAGAGIIGINNRDLATFKVDLAVTEKLRPLIPQGHIVVSESGVHTADDVKRLADCGVDALLVGESFMRAADKKALLAEFRAAGKPGRKTVKAAGEN